MTVAPVILDHRSPPVVGAPDQGPALTAPVWRAGAVAWQAAKRLGGSVAVILGVLTVTFLVTRVFAPDPTSLFLGAAGNGYTSAAAQAAARARVRAELGLNNSLPQPVRPLPGSDDPRRSRGVVPDRPPGDGGSAVPVAGDGGARGVRAHLRGGRGDRGRDRLRGATGRRSSTGSARFAVVGSLALPQFWIGLMLLWIFYTKLHLTPGPIGRLPLGTTPAPTVTGFYRHRRSTRR